MKKQIYMIAAVCLLLSMTFVMACAKTENKGETPLNREHSGYAEHLYLYEKNPDDWEVIDGAWGKMIYEDEAFVFNGHSLETGVEYALISYKEDWPGCGSIELGTGTANEFGNIHIMGAMNHVINDYPYGFGGDYQGVSGAKIWLVPSADKTGDCFNAWNPNEYLFESELIYQTPYEYTLLDLVSKDLSDWSILTDGAYGRLHYNSEDLKFFGYDLVPEKTYTLLNYDEAGHNTGHVILGSDVADSFGYVEIHAVMPELEYYTYTTGEYIGETGAKIWLWNGVTNTDSIWSGFPWGDPSQTTDILWETNLI